MNLFLGLFDPGWRDFSVRTSNTEITILWILAALFGGLLTWYFMNRKGKVSAEWQAKYDHIEKELQDEKNRHHRMKTQMEAAVAKANSFANAANEAEKQKHKIHDLHKEVEHGQAEIQKLKQQFELEHAKVTSMMVDHGEVESLKNRVRNQEKELHQLRQESQKHKSDLDLALSEKARLAASLNESQVNELKNKVQKLENDLHSSRLMVVKYQSETNAFEEEKKRIRDEAQGIEERVKESDILRNKNAQLEADLQKARQNLAELSSLRSEVESLKSEKDKWQNEAEVQAKNAEAGLSYQSRVSALESELNKQKEENKKLSEELSITANEKLNAIASSADATHLQSQLAEIKLKASMWESDLVSLRQTYIQLEEKYNRLNEEKRNLEEELNTVRLASKTRVKDDLEKIEGIGPKLEELLYENNIFSFRELADASTSQLQAILDKAGEQYRIHDPSTWPEQARLLAEGRFEEFETLTQQLKGGRRVEVPGN